MTAGLPCLISGFSEVYLAQKSDFPHTFTQPSCKEQTLDIRKTGWTVRPCRNPQLQIWIWVVDFWSWRFLWCFIGFRGVHHIICGRNPIACQDWEGRFAKWPDIFQSSAESFPWGRRMFGAFIPVVGATRHQLNSWFAELGRTWQFQVFDGCGESKRSNWKSLAKMAQL